MQCLGFSSCGTRTLEGTGSAVMTRGLSCPVACGILVLRSGIKLVSPALEGGFLTTGPPETVTVFFFNIVLTIWSTLQLYVNLRINFSFFYRKCHWNFERGSTESVDYFGMYFHLNNRSFNP